MHHPIAQLSQDDLRDVRGVLGDEVDPHPLGADETHHQLHLLHEGLRGVPEDQVGLVEAEDEPGLVQVPHLGEVLVQLRQEPQEEGRVKPRALDQLVRRQDVDAPVAPVVVAQQIRHPEHGLPEEVLPSLFLQGQEGPLDRPQGGGGDEAVPGRDLLHGVLFLDEGQEGPQVLQVQQQEALVVGHAEEHREHAALGLVEVEEPGEEQGAHVRDGGAQRQPRPTEEVPEEQGVPLEGVVRDAQHLPAPVDGRRRGTGTGEAREVSLHVRQEHRHPQAAEVLRQDLEGHGLPRARGPGDEAVAVAHPGTEEHGVLVLGEDEGTGIGVHGGLPWGGFRPATPLP